MKPLFLSVALACLVFVGGGAIIASVSSPALAQGAVSEMLARNARLQKLTALHRMNMAGDVFIEVCGAQALIMNSPYIGNIKAVDYMLARELMKQRGGIGTSDAQELIERRRESYVDAARKFFVDEGCVNSRAQAAQSHVEKMAAAPLPQFFLYLRDIENR